MTQPAAAAGAATQTLVQQLVQQLTAPLAEAAKAFSTQVATTLAKQVEEMTTSFNNAHPAVTAVTKDVVGWSSAVAVSTGSVATMAGNTRDMIRNTREMRKEISQVLDQFPVLDGLRLRYMLAADSIKKMNMETVKNSLSQARAAVATRLSAAATIASNVASKVAAVAARVWAVAQRALNLVLSLNPIGLVVAAIGLLIGGLVLAYQRSTTFRNIVNAAFTTLRGVVLGAFNAVRNAVNVVWPHVQQVIQTVAKVVRTVVTTYFTAVRKTVTTIFDAIRSVAGKVWTGIRTVISDAVSAVLRTVGNIRKVATTVGDAFGNARKAAAEAVTKLVKLVGDLPGQAVKKLGNLGRTLYGAGKDLIQGLINGIREMIGRVVSEVERMVDRIPHAVRDLLGISSPSRVMAGFGRNIGEGLVVGIDGSRDMVERAMHRLVPPPRSATVRSVTAESARLAVTRAASVTRGTATARPTGADPVTVNVYPRAAHSEYEIGRIAARELAWAAKR